MTTYLRFKYLARELSLLRYPATIVLHNEGSNGGIQATKGAALRIPQEWADFTLSINTGKAANGQLIFSPNSGWVNEGYSEGRTPLTQSLTFGGNIAKALEKRGRYYRIFTFDPAMSASKISEYFTEFHPDMLSAANQKGKPNLYIHQFTCLDKRGRHVLPGDGVIAYFPLITRDAAWVHESNVEVFDYIPEPDVPSALPPWMSLGQFVIVRKPFAIIYQRPNRESPKNRRAFLGQSLFAYNIAYGPKSESFYNTPFGYISTNDALL